jgi:hypothetical protein
MWGKPPDTCGQAVLSTLVGPTLHLPPDYYGLAILAAVLGDARLETAWVIMGDLLPGRPWTSLPQAARLSCRRSQLPAGEAFRTTTALAVELLRQADAESAAPILGVFDGAYAMDTVVQPCLEPAAGERRIAAAEPGLGLWAYPPVPL